MWLQIPQVTGDIFPVSKRQHTQGSRCDSTLGEKSISQYTSFKQRLEADSKIILSDIQRGQFNISKAQALHVITSKPHNAPAAQRPCSVEEEIKPRGQALTRESCLTAGPRILGGYCLACACVDIFPQAFYPVSCPQIQSQYCFGTP